MQKTIYLDWHAAPVPDAVFFSFRPGEHMKTLCVLQHFESDYLGLMEDQFEGRNIRFRYCRPFTPGGMIPATAEGYDGLIILGAGPLGMVSGNLILESRAGTAADARFSCARAAHHRRRRRGLHARDRGWWRHRRSSAAFCCGHGPTRRAAGAGRSFAGKLPYRCVYARSPGASRRCQHSCRGFAGEPALFQIRDNCFGFLGHPGINRQ